MSQPRMARKGSGKTPKDSIFALAYCSRAMHPCLSCLRIGPKWVARDPGITTCTTDAVSSHNGQPRDFAVFDSTGQSLLRTVDDPRYHAYLHSGLALGGQAGFFDVSMPVSRVHDGYSPTLPIQVNLQKFPE